MSNLRRVGQVAEDQAADFLLSLGYTLVTRRFKSRRGEIDLIALDGDILVFVEVKTRTTEGYHAEEAVNARKVSFLAAAAQDYLQLVGEPDRMIRFDLVAIDKTGLRHHVDAFRR